MTWRRRGKCEGAGRRVVRATQSKGNTVLNTCVLSKVESMYPIKQTLIKSKYILEIWILFDNDAVIFKCSSCINVFYSTNDYFGLVKKTSCVNRFAPVPV